MASGVGALGESRMENGDDSSFIVSSHHQDEWHRTVSHGIGCGSARGGTDEGGGATGSHLCGRLGPRLGTVAAAEASSGGTKAAHANPRGRRRGNSRGAAGDSSTSPSTSSTSRAAEAVDPQGQRDDYPEDYHTWSRNRRKRWRDKHPRK